MPNDPIIGATSVLSSEIQKTDGPGPRTSPPGTVLVVDDDASMRALILQWLKHSGVRALEASSGELALAIAAGEANTLDAIVLDVMMPGMDGFEVIRRLKIDERTARIPIVFLSASAAESDIVRGVKAGAVDYLQKPFSGPVLVTKVAAVIERSRAERALYDKLRTAEESAIHDGLTGLANRRAFDQRLAEVTANSVRHSEPVALLMLDIDKFKSINDSMGHLAGDAALKHLADKLRGVVRAGDQAFRYGGEEFALLLQKCDRAGAVLVYDRLRGTLSSAPLVFEGEAIPFSVSGGIASMEAGNEFELKNLIGRADVALYEAKRGGRDRVVLETGPRAT
jgi:two-component system, cell cycle response regulator